MIAVLGRLVVSPGSTEGRTSVSWVLWMSDELGELLAIARRAATIAGEAIMPLYEAGIVAELKEDRTPVTVADRSAELAMREFLERECPGHGVLGEEFGETLGDGRHRWILDPIDGTASFIRHVPLFGTLVGLERDGVPVVGVIACHAAGETAWAATRMGAHLNGEQIRVSEAERLRGSVVSSSVLTRSPAHMLPAVGALVREGARFQTWGDCYGYLMVAAGRAEVMLDPVMSIWDLVALYPVITEAGGQITTWDGEPGPGDSAIATNGLLHEAVLEAIRGADKGKGRR